MKRFFTSNFFILLTIYLSSVLVRILVLSHTPVYSDEITWMVRGKEFLYSLIHLNFDYFKTAWWTDVKQTEAISIPLSIINGTFHLIFAGVGKFSLKVLPDILASRLSLVLVNSLIPVAIFVFTRKLFSLRVGLGAALLYIVNPVVVGLDVLVMNDSLLSLFSFLSVFLFLNTAKDKKISFWPGFFLGLSFLTKPNGIIIGVSWIVVILLLRSRNAFKLLLLNIGSFFVTTIIFWPASWNLPILSVFEYIYRQYTLVKVGVPYFYLGEVSTSPSWTFYIFQFASRMSEISVIGIFISIYFFIKSFFLEKKNKISLEFWTLASYFLCFGILISFSSQKLGIRYAAPLIPYVCIVSAWGLWKLVEMFPRKLEKFILTFLIILSFIPLIKFFPDYYLYYNIFVGGSKGAQKYDMVGLCSSTKEAFEFLNSIKAEGSVFVAGCPAATNYYSSLQVVNDYLKADYIVIETYHRLQFPNNPLYLFLEDKTPIYEIEIQGAVIAKVYKIIRSQ